MKTKIYYILFWLQSSRGTNEKFVKWYVDKPSKETLKDDLEGWADGFAAMHVSDNHVSYGWKKLKRLPKNRKDALSKWDKLCKQRAKVNERYATMRGILACPPFNGWPLKEILSGGK